jgi:hypothetical protein
MGGYLCVQSRPVRVNSWALPVVETGVHVIAVVLDLVQPLRPVWRHNAKALKHRHVVEVRAGGVSAGIPFLAFEFCNGGSVFDLLKARGGILVPKEAVEIILPPKPI